ncbi:BQ5605_C036g11498 [Microbotryum silenes-dioicae]|uniref:BQ5605_C036g11498 protein n=1 Tax=Microbotryum silenes-dioicae TaxID=796604 RepID=A0A2X0MFJ8_9BASI|nr:BQ5605_C036g11498 [Microbotryum silenes-dioicae]
MQLQWRRVIHTLQLFIELARVLDRFLPPNSAARFGLPVSTRVCRVRLFNPILSFLPSMHLQVLNDLHHSNAMTSNALFDSSMSYKATRPRCAA